MEIAIGDAALEEAKPKNRAVPVWITNSAIDATDAATAEGQPPGQEAFEPMAMDEPDTAAAAGVDTNQDDDEITQILLRHERKDGAKAVIPGMAQVCFGTTFFRCLNAIPWRIVCSVCEK